MAQQTVLVVGGAGFLGRHVVRSLAAAGHKIYATFHSGKAPPALPGVHWLWTDVGRAEARQSWPRACDTLVYLAQARSWRRFPETAQDVFQVNVRGLMHAAWYAAEVGVRRFLYSSTGSVYTQKRQAATESDPVDLAEPRSFYVACKLSGELLLGPYQALFPVIQLRLFMPYGEGQSADMLLPRLVECVQEGQPIQLHGDDGLIANPVAAADVAETVRRCLDLTASVTLNVAGPETLTLRQIGQMIGRVLNQTPVFAVQCGQPAPVIAGDTTLLRQTLNWQPSTGLEQGLQQWLGSQSCYQAIPA